jgi:glycosyltransferase involved in cell wall biosynthesis
MKFSAKNHTFVVCAYKESEYLEECIRSLKNQTIKSNILISTSTPNPFIQRIAEKYELPVFVNMGCKGIADDWNFAYQQAQTELVTLAHQDDIYEAAYLEHVLSSLNHVKYPLICFTDYCEIKMEKRECENQLLSIKRLMLSPLKIKLFQSIKFVRRRILSLGCPICCPSVTFVKTALPVSVFQFGYKSDIDWQAWEKLSREKGQFVYCSKPLILHRIHAESETTRILENNTRVQEDLEMFCCFWPKQIAKVLVKIYSQSEKSNII